MRGFVAELSDGTILKEDTIHHTLAGFVVGHKLEAERPWKLLKKYIKNQGLKLVALHLEYDHQGVFLPRNAKAYFFSRKVEAFAGVNRETIQYTGIGATEHKDDEVVITWYDGEGSKLETRKVNAESDQFITN